MTLVTDFQARRPARRTDAALADRDAPGLARALAEARARIALLEAQAARREARIAELQSLAASDELTGLANRRAFQTELARLLARAARDGGGGTLALIDLDRFKAINDVHGHGAGDAALVAVAEALRGAVRGGDLVARLGGDEFAVLLPGLTGAAAARRLAQLRARLAAVPVPTPDALGLTVSGSLGAVAWGPTDTASDLMAAADRALYAAKPAGRA